MNMHVCLCLENERSSFMIAVSIRNICLVLLDLLTPLHKLSPRPAFHDRLHFSRVFNECLGLFPGLELVDVASYWHQSPVLCKRWRSPALCSDGSRNGLGWGGFLQLKIKIWFQLLSSFSWIERYRFVISFFQRCWFRIQDVQDLIRRISMILRHASFPIFQISRFWDFPQ